MPPRLKVNFHFEIDNIVQSTHVSMLAVVVAVKRIDDQRHASAQFPSKHTSSLS
jgi:hypothetical protein